MRLFRHRKHIRNTGGVDSGAASASARETAARVEAVEKSVENFVISNVVIPTSYPHTGSMSGEEVKRMNKSHRVAMAQALLAELSEATARYGAGNEGVKRLHRLVRDMVAQLLA
jgi:hypothetical protein